MISSSFPFSLISGLISAAACPGPVMKTDRPVFYSTSLLQLQLNRCSSLPHAPTCKLSFKMLEPPCFLQCHFSRSVQVIFMPFIPHLSTVLSPFTGYVLNLSAAYAQLFEAATLHKNNFLLSTHPDYCVQN